MQPLIVLSTVFAMLASYLQWIAPTPQAPSLQVSQAIVRDRAPVEQTVVKRATALPTPHMAQRSIKPLNLQLPQSVETSLQSLVTEKQTNILKDLFEAPSARERVTYNAELVFDRQTGEDITGGKVNIKIPLS